MSPTDELIPLLKKLRLSGVLQSLDLRTRQAADDNLAHTEFLYRLLSDEAERRDSKQLEQRLRRANFEHRKTIEDETWRVDEASWFIDSCGSARARCSSIRSTRRGLPHPHLRRSKHGRHRRYKGEPLVMRLHARIYPQRR